MFSGIIIAVSAAHCRAVSIWPCAESSHRAAVVGFSWADHFSLTAHHWAGTPTISSIISSHTIFIREAIVWHLTPLGIESSPTRQLFFPVAFGPHLFWTTVSQHGQWKN